MGASAGRTALVYALALAVLGVAGCAEDGPVAPTPLALPPSVGPTPSPTTTSPSVTVSDSPTPTPTPNAAPTSATPGPSPSERQPGPLIVIDPGHSGRSIRSTDAGTGLRDIDYPNYPEIYEMFDVSTCVAEGLAADGYRVILTKTRALDSVGLAARARVANDAHAALAISVHDDHSQTAAFQAVYSQRGVKHGGSYHEMYRGTGSSRTVYRNVASARRSEAAAKTIARARAEAQGQDVSVRENIYTGRAPLEPGNLAIVQLLSDVPWVYNEMGAKTAGSTTRAMSIASETGYAKGLLIGVENAVPLASGAVAQPSPGAQLVRSCLVRAVEPEAGTFTRPTRYLPYGF